MAAHERTVARERPRNPYIFTKPVAIGAGFYGRSDILRWVEQSLFDDRVNSLVLYGQRRTGKTSLLLELQNSLARAHFCPVYLDLMHRASARLDELLSEISEKLADAAGLAPRATQHSHAKSDWFRSEFIPELCLHLGAARRPLLLLDEFDVLDYAERRELPNDAAARSLIPYLSQLLGAEPRLACIFVLGRQPQEVSDSLKSTLRGSEAKEVWLLEARWATELVLEAERQGTLRFTPEAVDRILFLTSGHTYLTQLLCYTLWTTLWADGPGAVPLVTIEDVNDAIQPALDKGIVGLDWIWTGLPAQEKVYAAAVAQATTDEGESIAGGKVEEILRAHAPRLWIKPVRQAPGSLVKRKVLVRERGPRYRFAVELMRVWIKSKKAIDDVKEELDRIDPASDLRYQEAEAQARSGESDAAIEVCEKVLSENPYHFGARLLLGQALLQQGRLLEAIQALERAYQDDPQEATTTLAQAWKARAIELGPSDTLGGDQIREAAAAYRRLAELQPGEARWREAHAETQREALVMDRFSVGVQTAAQGLWHEAQRAFADVVYLRPTYGRERLAAELLLEAVRAQPQRSAEAQLHLPEPDREMAYGLNAQQYGMGYEHTIGQCTIHHDGSGSFRRQVELLAYSVVTELNYYTKLPEMPEESDVEYQRVRSLDPEREIRPEKLIDTRSEIEIRNRIVPPLLPGERLRYEGIETFSNLYAMPPIDVNAVKRRQLPFDYYARDTNCPSRKLTIEVVFPAGVEPIDPWTEVWYAVGMSMVPHPSEGQRIQALLRKHLLGEFYTLTLEIQFPVLGLTYVIAWRPDLLVLHDG